MAIVVRNTNYNGEVLEKILVLATTGNDLVEKGLIMVIPGVEKKSACRVSRRARCSRSVRRTRLWKTRKAISITRRNHWIRRTSWRSRLSIPVPSSMFGASGSRRATSCLPNFPEAQNTLLDELSKSVKFELGWHYLNGEFGSDDDHLFNGILTQAAKDPDVIVVPAPSDTSMIGKLKAVRKAIPKALRENPNLRILMSIDDFDKYDDELTEREYKNTSETDINKKRYKGITIETLNSWPDGLIVATLCSMSADGNLFAGVNLQDDEEVIQIDKWMNSSELYFFKLLMKADTEIAFGEEFVVLDTRETPVFKVVERSISADPAALSFKAAGESKEVKVTASGDYSVVSIPAGFTAVGTDGSLTVTAGVNSSGKAVSGTLVLGLDADPEKKVEIALSQAAVDEEEGGE